MSQGLKGFKYRTWGPLDWWGLKFSSPVEHTLHNHSNSFSHFFFLYQSQLQYVWTIWALPSLWLLRKRSNWRVSIIYLLFSNRGFKHKDCIVPRADVLRASPYGRSTLCCLLLIEQHCGHELKIGCQEVFLTRCVLFYFIFLPPRNLGFFLPTQRLR